MARTIYTHANCGGCITAKLTGFILVSPHIGISIGGKTSITNFQFLTDDFKTPNGDKEVPIVYICMKCGREITGEKAGEEIVACCTMCGETHPIGELYSTDFTPITCMDCINKMKGDSSEEFRKLFDIPSRIRKSLIADNFIVTYKI